MELDQIVLLQIQLQYCVFNSRENESNVLRVCFEADNTIISGCISSVLQELNSIRDRIRQG